MEKEGSFLNDGDIDELKGWLNTFEVQLRQKKGKEAEAKNQRSKTSIQATEDTTFTTRTIDSALKFGGMLPAMQKEKELNERLNVITEMIQYMDSPEQVQELRRELDEGQVELNRLQRRSSESVLGKQSAHWKTDAGFTDKMAKLCTSDP